MTRAGAVTLDPDPDEQRLRAFVKETQQAGIPRLPPEPQLSERIGVSRGRLRTLLKRIEDDGLIWRHVGKGTFVGQRQDQPADGNLADYISVDDVMAARLVLEPQLAAQAAIHAKPRDITAMDDCVRAMRSADTFLQWRRLDEKLHRTVAEATHNALLLMVFDAMRAQAKVSLEARMEEIFGRLSGPASATPDEHLDFIDAIRAHSPERAEQAMRQHIQSVRAALFGLR